jgi:hypothetical protein
MSMGASATKEGGRPGSLVRAGRPRGRRADRPRVGSLPPPNRYVREMTDSGNRKLASSSFQHDNRSQFSIGLDDPRYWRKSDLVGIMWQTGHTARQ